MSERSDLWRLADAIQMDLRAAQTKMVELRSILASLSLPDSRPSCPLCGYRSAMNLPSIAEHVEQVHQRDLCITTPRT